MGLAAGRINAQPHPHRDERPDLQRQLEPRAIRRAAGDAEPADLAAGLAGATPAEVARLGIHEAPPYDGVDLRDVAEILRRVTGLVP